jgi:hypothetical protein
VLEAELRRARPEERKLADAVGQHVHDERRHCRMFRAWCVGRGVMPFRIDPGAGYVDRLVPWRRWPSSSKRSVGPRPYNTETFAWRAPSVRSWSNE